MSLDYVEVAVLVLSGANFLLLSALLLGIRQLSKGFGNLPGLFRSLIDGMLWQEGEETDAKGVAHKVKRLNPEIAAAVEAVAPMIVAQGAKYIQKNVKVQGGGGAAGGLGGILGGLMGGAGGGGGLEAMIPMLIERFAPALLGAGGPKGGGGTAGPVQPIRNP